MIGETIEVSLQRDFWDWLAVLSAPVAILLAGLAIWLSWRIDRKTANRLVIEAGRSMDLQVLLYLLEAADDDRCLNVDQTARLAFFATVELPTWHALWDGSARNRTRTGTRLRLPSPTTSSPVPTSETCSDARWPRRSGGVPLAEP